MKRFRLRLSSLLWLAAVAAAFLAGIRSGEYRAVGRRGKQRVVRNMVLSAAEGETLKVQVYRGER
jgi:hypothetical protein